MDLKMAESNAKISHVKEDNMSMQVQVPGMYSVHSWK